MSYVLIVDDDIIMAEALSDMVGLFDYETKIVHGPRPAMQAIWATPPYLILLDLNMPGFNGLEVCRYIKRDPIAGNTPVVFVTAEDAPSVREEAMEAGAEDFLVKPVEIDELEKLLKRFIK